MKLVIAAAAGLTVLAGLTQASAQPAQAPAPAAAPSALTPIPDNLRPRRIQSQAFVVADLTAQRAWYETVLGMTYVRNVGANQVILTMDPGNPNASNIALQRGTRQPGATSYGRLILNVADAPATAAYLQSQGIATREVLPGQAYFFNDPEGNLIELYQPAPPTAAN